VLSLPCRKRSSCKKRIVRMQFITRRSKAHLCACCYTLVVYTINFSAYKGKAE